MNMVTAIRKAREEALATGQSFVVFRHRLARGQFPYRIQLKRKYIDSKLYTVITTIDPTPPRRE
jgi:hypothetical protein